MPGDGFELTDGHIASQGHPEFSKQFLVERLDANLTASKIFRQFAGEFAPGFWRSFSGPPESTCSTTRSPSPWRPGMQRDSLNRNAKRIRGVGTGRCGVGDGHVDRGQRRREGKFGTQVRLAQHLIDQWP